MAQGPAGGAGSVRHEVLVAAECIVPSLGLSNDQRLGPMEPGEARKKRLLWAIE